VSFDLLSKALESEGYCESRQFLDANLCTKIYNKVKQILESVDLSVTQDYEHFSVANEVTSKKPIPIPRYGRGRPIIHVRGAMIGTDIGFIQMFDPEKIIKEIPTDKISNFINKTMSGLGHSKNKIEYIIYWNANGLVEKTRGYHRDSVAPWQGTKRLFKSFIYLTDVPDMSYGPYSYIPGTHRKEDCFAFANQLVGKYDDPNEYDLSMLPKIFVAPKGTVIISNQGGMHRGLQQKEGKERMVLVCKIRPE